MVKKLATIHVENIKIVGVEIKTAEEYQGYNAKIDHYHNLGGPAIFRISNKADQQQK
jgi:hypothetical protein